MNGFLTDTCADGELWGCVGGTTECGDTSNHQGGPPGSIQAAAKSLAVDFPSAMILAVPWRLQ